MIKIMLVIAVAAVMGFAFKGCAHPSDGYRAPYGTGSGSGGTCH